MEEKAIEVGANSLEQISLLNPVLALLLLLLIVIVVTLSIAVFKLSKKINEQSNQLYQEAKADFELVLAFEKKLDRYLDKDVILINDMKDIKSGIQEIKSYLGFMHNK